MALDMAWLGYYMPIFAFTFVFAVIYAILMKTKIVGDNFYVTALTATVISIIFISFSPGVSYIGTVVPWIAIIFIALFFVLMLVMFSQKEVDKFMGGKFTWVFVMLLGLIFLGSAVFVFGPIITESYPNVAKFLFTEKVIGGGILLVVAAAAAWLVTRKTKE